MVALQEAAPAKINLYLEVLGRRPDGYHDLDSLVVFADVGERLEAARAGDMALAVTGPMAAGLAHEADNLVLRAAHALRALSPANPGARLVLDKRMPVASGIGGGSADAAAALRLLNRLWALALDEASLCRLGARLGADVPACVRARPTRFQGTGAILAEAPALPAGLGLVLANPKVAVATREVFAGVAPRGGKALDLPARFKDFADLRDFLSMRGNDLTAPAARLAPAIAQCLAALKAAAPEGATRMSGSGATCFALVGSVARAKGIAAQIAATHPDWWLWAGPLGQPALDAEPRAT
ncbi:MAG: 4-(cytidine 5'-diphospho)-2-C-methyl-D-erythritol kinase [Pseudomonadota bacterium]|jgi:4-diphosphocytidyl-2-C-methyl-D-erythritol kinase